MLLAIIAVALAWANHVARSEQETASRAERRATALAGDLTARLDRELFEKTRLAFLRDDLVATSTHLSEAFARGQDTPALRLIAGLLDARRSAFAGTPPGDAAQRIRKLFASDRAVPELEFLTDIGHRLLAVQPFQPPAKTDCTLSSQRSNQSLITFLHGGEQLFVQRDIGA